MSQKISAEEIPNKLSKLIDKAQIHEPLLAERLKVLSSWIRNLNPGKLRSKKYVLAVLIEVCLISDRWLLLQQADKATQEQFLKALDPAERYWTEVLFPAWFHEKDPKLTTWQKELMAGKFEAKDAQFIKNLCRQIELKGGYSVYQLLVDLSMATDLIVGNTVGMCLCVQLTTVNKDYLQEKLTEWEKTLRHWEIERGLLVSYIPNSDCEGRLVKIILSANDTLGVGQYKMKESK
jgi:hypothetical protein